MHYHNLSCYNKTTLFRYTLAVNHLVRAAPDRSGRARGRKSSHLFRTERKRLLVPVDQATLEIGVSIVATVIAATLAE